MPCPSPSQPLRRYLKEAAANLKWAGVDLFGVAKRMLAAGDEEGANELMRLAFSVQEIEDKLAGYAEEVRNGRIFRPERRYYAFPWAKIELSYGETTHGKVENLRRDSSAPAVQAS